MKPWLVVLLLLPAAMADGGGEVLNKAPVVIALDNALGPAPASGADEVLMAVVADDNLEHDLQRLQVTTLLGPSIDEVLDIVHPLPATRPAATDGWRVWDEVSGDGRLQVEFEHKYSVDALHRWRLSVFDEGTTPGTMTLDVDVAPVVRISSDPVNATGHPMHGSGWGAWSVNPGATSIQSSNFIRIENTGSKATQAAVLDFTQAVFIGADEPDFGIAIDDNLRFAWWEGPAGSTPANATWSFGTLSSNGAVTVQFSEVGNVIFISYEIVSMPAILYDQSYLSGYSVVAV